MTAEPGKVARMPPKSCQLPLAVEPALLPGPAGHRGVRRSRSRRRRSGPRPGWCRTSGGTPRGSSRMPCARQRVRRTGRRVLRVGVGRGDRVLRRPGAAGTPGESPFAASTIRLPTTRSPRRPTRTIATITPITIAIRCALPPTPPRPAPGLRVEGAVRRVLGEQVAAGGQRLLELVEVAGHQVELGHALRRAHVAEPDVAVRGTDPALVVHPVDPRHHLRRGHCPREGAGGRPHAQPRELPHRPLPSEPAHSVGISRHRARPPAMPASLRGTSRSAPSV